MYFRYFNDLGNASRLRSGRHQQINAFAICFTPGNSIAFGSKLSRKAVGRFLAEGSNAKCQTLA
jgi:hypothetical protein